MKRFRLSVALLAVSMFGCGGGGGSTSSSTTVATAPTISSDPESITVSTGSAWSFSVAASGSSLTYQWYKLSDSSASAISGATASTYGNSSATTSDAGTYYVVVSNSAGSVTSGQAVLTVDSSTGGATIVVK